MYFPNLIPDPRALWHYVPTLRATALDPSGDIEAQPLTDLLASVHGLAISATKFIPTSYSYYKTGNSSMQNAEFTASPSTHTYTQSNPTFSPIASSSPGPSSRTNTLSPTPSEKERAEAAQRFLYRAFEQARRTGITDWPTQDEFDAQAAIDDQEEIDEEAAYSGVLDPLLAPSYRRESFITRCKAWAWGRANGAKRQADYWGGIAVSWTLGRKVASGIEKVIGRRVRGVVGAVNFDFDDNIECVCWCCVGGLAVLGLGLWAWWFGR